MPNWCECELTVKGRKEEVDSFTAKVITEDKNGENAFDFNVIVPMPEELLIEEEKDLSGLRASGSIVPRWYEWRVANWGTKWNASDLCDIVQQTLKNGVKSYFAFSTAWSPPIPVIEAAAAKFPTLEFTLKYWEGGCGFRGTAQFKNGRCVKNATFDYSGRRGG